MSRAENYQLRNEAILKEFQERYKALPGKAQSKTDVVVHALAEKYYLSPNRIRIIITNTTLPTDPE